MQILRITVDVKFSEKIFVKFAKDHGVAIHEFSSRFQLTSSVCQQEAKYISVSFFHSISAGKKNVKKFKLIRCCKVASKIEFEFRKPKDGKLSFDV